MNTYKSTTTSTTTASELSPSEHTTPLQAKCCAEADTAGAVHFHQAGGVYQEGVG